MSSNESGALQKPLVKNECMQSLHGEGAARRQAITELLFFAGNGDLLRCKKIVASWFLNLKDAHCCDYDKRTPLHLAAAEGAHSIVEWLIKEVGVDVNPVDRFKRTPLEEAVRGDHGDVAQTLMGHGAKVLNKDGELVDLADSPLAGNVRIFLEFDPEWEIDPSAITLVDKIGEGEFGVVYKARWHGTIVAVKVLKENSAVALGDFRTELNVLQKVHHPHTVQFLGAATKKFPLMIVTEYMAGGSLADMFRSSSTYPNLWRAVHLALDMAKGMAYLHNRSPQAVIHRDLKPANLMIGGPKVFNPFHKKLLTHEIGVLKIGDFGLSKSLKIARSKMHAHICEKQQSKDLRKNEDGRLSQSYKLTGETGSYRFMAPEVFRHEPYNTKVDVYAFAMICYQLFENMPPFWMYDPVEAARMASLEGKRPTWTGTRQVVPEPLRKLVEDCWAQDHDARPDFDDIIVRLEDIVKAYQPVVTSGAAGGDACSCSVM